MVMIGTALAAPIHDEFREKVIKFHQEYDVFLRKYLGCPPRTKTPQQQEQDKYVQTQCEAMLGIVDQVAWHKTREAAKELFDLEEKK